MGQVCRWLLTKRLALFNYINTSSNPVQSAPPPQWWIVIAGISALTDLINPTFVKLQSPNLLVSTQTEALQALAVDIAAMIGIRLQEDDDVMPGVERCKGGIAELFTKDLVNRTEESHSLWDC
jgi:hypothetical protein